MGNTSTTLQWSWGAYFGCLLVHSLFLWTGVVFLHDWLLGALLQLELAVLLYPMMRGGIWLSNLTKHSYLLNWLCSLLWFLAYFPLVFALVWTVAEWRGQSFGVSDISFSGFLFCFILLGGNLLIPDFSIRDLLKKKGT